MLNKYTSKLEPGKLESHDILRELYWDCTSRVLQNKTICYPGSADTILGDNFVCDISYSLKNMDRKHRELFHNLFMVIGLELLISLDHMEVLAKNYTEKLTPQMQKEAELARSYLKGDPILDVDDFSRRLNRYLKHICI